MIMFPQYKQNQHGLSLRIIEEYWMTGILMLINKELILSDPSCIPEVGKKSNRIMWRVIIDS